MKLVALCLAVPLVLASAAAGAQAQAPAPGDAVDKLRACSVLASAERIACLEKLSHDIGPAPPKPATAAAPQATPAADNWIVSETTSPFDYSPIAVATVSTRSRPDGAPLQLSIQCRRGGTELVIASTALAPRGEPYVAAYRIDDGAPVPLATGTAASGTGVAIRGDVVRLLASLPDRGDIFIQLAARQGAPLEGRYALAGLKGVLGRLAGPCNGPTD